MEIVYLFLYVLRRHLRNGSGNNVNDSAVSAGDTTITVTSGTNIGVGDVIAFSTTVGTNDYDDGVEYEVTVVSSNDITLKEKSRFRWFK